MSRQLRIDFPGAIHHVTSRGNERRIIYRDDRDRLHFLELLEEVVVMRRWILHAWVLMSNHYHLLIETPEVELSRGMKKLNESYARWFNTRHRRVGHLREHGGDRSFKCRLRYRRASATVPAGHPSVDGYSSWSCRPKSSIPGRVCPDFYLEQPGLWISTVRPPRNHDRWTRPNSKDLFPRTPYGLVISR